MDRPRVSIPEAPQTRQLSGTPSSIPKLGGDPLSEYAKSAHLLADALVREPLHIIIFIFVFEKRLVPNVLMRGYMNMYCPPLASATPSAVDESS